MGAFFTFWILGPRNRGGPRPRELSPQPQGGVGTTFVPQRSCQTWTDLNGEGEKIKRPGAFFVCWLVGLFSFRSRFCEVAVPFSGILQTQETFGAGTRPSGFAVGLGAAVARISWRMLRHICLLQAKRSCSEVCTLTTRN